MSTEDGRSFRGITCDLDAIHLCCPTGRCCSAEICSRLKCDGPVRLLGKPDSELLDRNPGGA